MTPAQVISIVVAVLVSAVIVSASLIMNMPKTINNGQESNDQQNVDNGVVKRESQNKTSQKFSLRDIITSITTK